MLSARQDWVGGSEGPDPRRPDLNPYLTLSDKNGKRGPPLFLSWSLITSEGAVREGDGCVSGTGPRRTTSPSTVRSGLSSSKRLHDSVRLGFPTVLLAGTLVSAGGITTSRAVRPLQGTRYGMSVGSLSKSLCIGRVRVVVTLFPSPSGSVEGHRLVVRPTTSFYGQGGTLGGLSENVVGR